jgi:hypothetical protein
MKGGNTRLGVGGTPLVTIYLHKTNVFLKNLTERTIMTNRCIFKGLNRIFFSLRDQYETQNIFKGLKDQLSLNLNRFVITQCPSSTSCL